uniref:Uncharacterized protein n=1 Tax=Aegilops tauschii subsp. strangulata TaxID=200361 RepID=A0A453FQB1_AEGTS
MAVSKLAAVSLLLVSASLAAVLLLRPSGADDGGAPWGAGSGILTSLPFSPTDVLPLLPRRVAMAALRALRGASDIFPVFVGAATAGPAQAGTAPVGWKGACFYENEAWLSFHNDSGSKYGGGTVHLKVRHGASRKVRRRGRSPRTAESLLRDRRFLIF